MNKNINDQCRNCVGIFDLFWHCSHPSTQMKYYYYTGELEGCMDFLTDWRKCMQLKNIEKNSKESTDIIESMTIYKSHQEIQQVSSKTKPIWTLKHTPNWTNNNK